MSLHEPGFRFILGIQFAQHQPRMLLGRRILARQVEQPHKPTRSSILLPFSAPIGGSPTMAVNSVATPANTLGGASTKMRDAERTIWMHCV